MDQHGEDQHTGESPRTRLSRRALARGVAWSVPVVAIAAPAPAVAASQCPTMTAAGITATGTSSYNTVTIRNNGLTPLPAGTTFTFVVRNDSDPGGRFTLSNLVGLTANVLASGSLGANATFTFTLTLANDLAPGATAAFRVTPYFFWYTARLSVSRSGCPAISRCYQVRGSTITYPASGCP